MPVTPQRGLDQEAVRRMAPLGARRLFPAAAEKL